MAVAYERRDIDLARLARIGFVVTSIVVMAFVVAWWLLGALVKHEAMTSGQPHPLAETVGRTTPPPPRLQPNPRSDLLALRAKEQATLETYGWIDREHGVVRIPIERAIDTLAKRGMLARPAPEGGEQ